jgi:hypothetical protein
VGGPVLAAVLPARIAAPDPPPHPPLTTGGVLIRSPLDEGRNRGVLGVAAERCSTKILYLHGLTSKPGGVKPTLLNGQGHDVINPGMPDNGFAASVHIAQDAYDFDSPTWLLGAAVGVRSR